MRRKRGDSVRFGVSLLGARPETWIDLAQAAEELGFESVWVADHLVLTTDLRNDVDPSRRVGISPQTPVFDPMVMLAAIAARTSMLRLGTFVYQLGLRHPFVAARAVSTVDWISGGRVELGLGVGYMAKEWRAAQHDFASRGRQFDEALKVCLRLWNEPVVTHHGEFFEFEEVVFEPKPVQRPSPPLHVGGASDAAFRRTIRLGADWVGGHHVPATAAPRVRRLREIERLEGAERTAEVTCAADPSWGDLAAWAEIGVHRLLVTPWSDPSDPVRGLEDFACSHSLRHPEQARLAEVQPGADSSDAACGSSTNGETSDGPSMSDKI